MSSRFDVLRSLVRGATRSASRRVRNLGPVTNARRVLAELKAMRATLTEGALSSAVAQAEGVEGATVRITGGRVLVDVDWTDGEHTAVAIWPERARFAPRGAKEVVFRVDPPEHVRGRRTREIVGGIAAAIARALWGPVLGARGAAEQALVETEGARLRCDLRTVPAVRAAFDGSGLAPVLDVIALEGFVVEENYLRLQLKLPTGTPF